MTKQKGKSSGFHGTGTSKHAIAKKETQKKADTRVLIVGAIMAVIGLGLAWLTGGFSIFG